MVSVLSWIIFISPVPVSIILAYLYYQEGKYLKNKGG